MYNVSPNARLEPFIFKWKPFDGMYFSRQPGKHRSHDAAHRARILTTLMRKRLPSEAVSLLPRLQCQSSRQSCEPGLSHPGRRRARLTLLAPRRSAFLARSRNPGAQTNHLKMSGSKQNGIRGPGTKVLGRQARSAIPSLRQSARCEWQRFSHRPDGNQTLPQRPQAQEPRW